MDDTDSLVPGVKDWFLENKWSAVMGLIGLFLLIMGVGEWFGTQKNSENDVVVIDEASESEKLSVVDVSGAVLKPGVHSFEPNSRLGEVIEAAGGFAEGADLVWVSKTLNLAQIVKDGDKIYIPFTKTSRSDSETSNQTVLGDVEMNEPMSLMININTASQSELEKLWGIGDSRASTIISNRPYEKIDQIMDKAGVPNNVFEKIKDQISVF